MSEILDLLLAGMVQPQADQPNNLAEAALVGGYSDVTLSYPYNSFGRNGPSHIKKLNAGASSGLD
eukprot:715210-Pelagomonas_calceolata.AAC.1